MRSRFIIAAFLVLMPLQAFAQNHTVTVSLQDSETGEPVGFATVSVSSGNDVKYSLADQEGKASVAKVKKGTYTLKAELLGYKTFTQNITVEKNLDLGIIKLTPDKEVLDAAVVSDVGNPIVVKKDTIEYNASSFKVAENDMLVDLLKKLPGIEVDEDGTIKSNGQTVSKVTIDGKTFFLNDPQLAASNLPANLVNKLRVVQKKSEQAEFTGIDDGKEETILDISVRPGMMNGLFGNAQLGAGHDLKRSSDYLSGKSWKNDGWRYQGALFAGKFTDKAQISVVLNGNNTNNRGFNDLSGGMMAGMRGGGGGMGRGGGGFGTGSGITSSWMGGLNANTTLLDGKMQLSGNYVYTGTDRNVMEQSLKNTYLDDGSTLDYSSDGSSNTRSDGHRIGIKLEHKFSDNTSILFEPQVNFGTGSFGEISTFETLKSGETLMNDGFTYSGGSNRNVSTSGRFLLRQKLGLPGRTLTLNTTYSFSNNDLEGFNQSLTSDYQTGRDSIINQRYDQNRQSKEVSATATYTEPLGNHFYVEANYTFSFSDASSHKDTYRADPSDPFTAVSHPYSREGEVLYEEFSNRITNRSINQNIGANVLYQNDKLRAQVGLGVMPTLTWNTTLQGTASRKYDDRMLNFAPRTMVRYEINDNSNLRINYNGRSSQPSVSQLMPVPDNTNPLYVSYGNPALRPYFSHSLRAEYRYTNRKSFLSMNVSMSGSVVQNPILNATWYIGGAQYTLPVNGPASQNYNLSSFLNAPIAKSGFSISNNLSAGYSRSNSYVGSSSFNHEAYDKGNGDFDYDTFNKDFPGLVKDGRFNLNRTRNFNASERLRLTYRNDAIEVSAGASTSLRKSWYTVSSAQTGMTFNNQATASVIWTISDTWSMKSDMNYNWYNGYSIQQESEYILNAQVTKLFLKKKLSLSLLAYDLLNQAKNLSVRDASNYHQETRNNTLGRYIILSATYRFGNFQRSGRGGYRGGGAQGGGRPGGGGRTGGF